MAPSTTYAEQVGLEVTENLEKLGVKDGDRSPASVGRRLALAAQAESIWEDHFGPLLTSADARGALGGISRQGLAKRVGAGTVLRLRDDRGRIRYPGWQFDPATEAAYPLLVEVISLFRERGADDWEIASFCTTPVPELGDKAPARLLMTSEGSEDVITAARRALARLFD